jgi:hypothetical protein
MSYKQILLEVKKLQGQAGVAAFDRITLLVQVFEDKDFRADQGDFDDIRAGEFLSDFCEDLSLNFWQLRAILEHFPNRDSWGGGKLATMHATMLEDKAAAQDCEPKTPRRSVKVADYDRVVSEAESLRLANEELKEVNERLTEENKLLTGRLFELERLLPLTRATA